MVPYGTKKQDNLCNRVGCCEQCRKHQKETSFKRAEARAAKKRARFEAKQVALFVSDWE